MNVVNTTATALNKKVVILYISYNNNINVRATVLLMEDLL